MYKDIKKLLNQSLIYGLGDILNRVAAFLLLPVYTNYLKPTEFGTLEMFYVTSSVLSVFLGRQLSHATLRFYFEYDSLEDRCRVVSTCFMMYVIFAGMLLSLCMLFSTLFSKLIFADTIYSKHFVILFAWMFFDLSKEVLYSYVRAIERARLFVFISFNEMVLKLLFCSYFVIFTHLSVLGVLLGNLAGTCVAWIILSSFTIAKCGLKIDIKKFQPIIKYTIPLVFVGLSGTIIGNADRFFLKNYTSLAAVGLYGLAMRFSWLLRFLVLQPFTKGYGPFRFSIMKQENAREIYARVTTYFSFFCCWCAIALIGYSREIIQIMAKPDYWPSYSLIPLLLVAVICEGLYYMFQIGVYINKNTRVLTYVFGVAAVLNILFLWALVRIWEGFGAAGALGATQIFVAIMGLYCSNRVYRIQYEWKRLSKILFVSLALLPFVYISYTSNPYWSGLAKTPFIAIYPLILFIVRFFEPEELKRIGQFRVRVIARIQGVVN